MYMTNVKLTDSARYKCVASNPAGNVTFSLNVVWPAPPSTTAAERPPRPKGNVIVADATSQHPPSTAAAAEHVPNPKGNVIVADATSQPSGGRQFRDEAVPGGKKKGPYDWGINKPEMKLGSKVEEGEVKPVEDPDVRFTIVDVVGAVVGTFLVTVLLCVLVAQLYWRRKERLRQEDHYSVPDSKPPLAPARLYIMGEDGENRVRMLHSHGHTECPT